MNGSAPAQLHHSERDSGPVTSSTPLGLAQRLTEELNQESYPFGMFARASDLVSHCVFSPRAFKPYFTGRAEVSTCPLWPPHAVGLRKIATFDDTARVYEALEELITGKVEPSRENAVKAVERVIGLPAFSLARDRLQDKHPLWKNALVHMILRYAILMQKDGLAKIAVTQVMLLGSIRLTLGLKASQNIRAGTLIMDTCSSLSSNIIDFECEYTLKSGNEQSGPDKTHTIIGPLRLVRHDCKPNTDVFIIQDSSAVVLRALTDIAEGSDLTLDTRSSPFVYTATTSTCWCSTCTHLLTDDDRGRLIHSSVLKPVSDERATEIGLLNQMRGRLHRQRKKQNRRDRGEPAHKPRDRMKNRAAKVLDNEIVGTPTGDAAVPSLPYDHVGCDGIF